MDKKLLDIVNQGLKENNSFDEIKNLAKSKGYLEKDVNFALDKASKLNKNFSVKNKLDLSKNFLSKEIFDRIGYGFGSEQFINILFYHTGASFFIIGIVNGLKAIISVLISAFSAKYNETNEVKTRTIARFGIIFGFSFLLMAIARFIHSVPLFITAIFLGSVSVVSHGEMYQKLISDVLKKEQRQETLKKIAYYGIFILAISMFFSAYLMNTFPATGKEITIFGSQMRVYGYLISFEITAFAFIISGFILSFVKDKAKNKVSISEEFENFYYTLKYNAIKYLHNKTTRTLLIAGTITGFTQTIGFSYYGIYIYQIFNKLYFKGFMNIAIVFITALALSIFSPMIAQKFSKHYGNIPMLVFGTLLISIMPFTFYFNPTIYTITIGTALSIIGSAIVGVATGSIIASLISKKDRKIYYATFSFTSTIPYLLTIPIGALASEILGLRLLFLYLGIILALIVAPIYFILLLIKREEII